MFADVYIGSGDDGFYVLAEGPGEAELLAWLARGAGTQAARGRERPSGVCPRSASDSSVDGPYAWEVVSGSSGPPSSGCRT